MKAMPAKSRDLTIFGISMAVTATCWLLLGDFWFMAASFALFGVGTVVYAVYLWRRPNNA